MDTTTKITRAGARWLVFDGDRLVRTMPVIAGGDGPVAVETRALSRVLKTLTEARDRNRAALDAVLDAGEKRAVNGAAPSWDDTEQAEIRRLGDELAAQEARIVELAELEQRDRSVGQALVSLGAAGEVVEVRREPLTYERHERRTSYFRDLGLAFVGGDAEARSRLNRHAAEMDVELPKREERQRREFERRMSDAEFRGYQVERRDISRTDGAGGEFVPPLWLMDIYAEGIHAGRPFADRCRNIPLPGGTDSINIPRITTAPATAAQTADNAAVQETDMVTNSVACPVRTIAGQQDVALQLLEQSPLMFDELVFAELEEDYNEKLDTQLLNGSGSSGQLTGILNVSGLNSVTYTDASPTVPELFPKGADALNQAHTNRKRAISAHFMAPRRWYWMTAALDANSRPLVVPVANGPYMAQGVVNDVSEAGPVGSWHGVPVILDPNMPTNLGAGTNEDRIVTSRMQDHVLFEGVMRTRALPEVLSGNLTVRLQVYRYVAFTAARFPTGTSVISGTGLATPSF